VFGSLREGVRVEEIKILRVCLQKHLSDVFFRIGGSTYYILVVDMSLD
jgi:hypothetical protein